MQLLWKGLQLTAVFTCVFFWSLEFLPMRKEWSGEEKCTQSSRVNHLDQWASFASSNIAHNWAWKTMGHCALMLKNLQPAKVNKAGFFFFFLKLLDQFQTTIKTQSKDFISLCPGFLLSLWKTENRWGRVINYPRRSEERASGGSNTTPPGKQNRWRDGERFAPSPRNSGCIFHRVQAWINIGRGAGCLRVSCQWAATGPALIPTVCTGQNRRDGRFHSASSNKQHAARHLPSQEKKKTGRKMRRSETETCLSVQPVEWES